MTPKLIAFAAFTALLAVTPVLVGSAMGQEAYPSKPIKIVLPIPSGTALDVVTRLVSNEMAKRLGQPVLLAGTVVCAQSDGALLR